MDKTVRLERLRSMLLQISPDGRLESLADLPPAGPVTELAGMGAPQPPSRALEKLAANRDAATVTREEMFHLEAIVMPQNRPVAFVRNNRYDDVAAPWLHLNTPALRDRISPLLASIGRVEIPGDPRIPFGGTGFIVGPNLLMTNRHVARLFCSGVGTRSLAYRFGDSSVNFKRELDSPPNDATAQFVVTAVEMIHPYWDMALLRIEGPTDRFAPLSLAVIRPEELEGRDVVVVGYPARDDRSDLDLQDRIFERQYNVKRLQPGKIRSRARVASFENVVNAVTHDSSTLGGNSGSAVLDVETGEIVGLHFAGVYLKANYAVPAYELARDDRVVGAGLNFSGSVTFTRDWQSVWSRADGVETGALAAAGTSINRLPALEATLKVPFIYAGLDNRTGFQPGFLGDTEIPLPELTGAGRASTAKLDDGSAELKYHKFSVVMHKERRMALFTAANVDWRPESRLVNGRKPTRKELTGLPEGAAEQWVIDRRIDTDHQLPDIFYTKDGGAFDKGHLVRRDDVCWGSSFKDIQKSNGDTYHTTNCSPQVAGFNQASKGDENWGELENLVQQQTKAGKAITFAGPVFEEDDPMFEGRGEQGRLMVRIPRRYWKVIVVTGTTGPETYGFVLEQDLSGVPLEEFAVPKKWQAHMKSIAEIEAMLGGLARFPAVVKSNDRAGSNESVAINGALSRV